MVKKSGFIWNTVGSFISAVLNAILLVFCTRLNGIEIAGMFSISYATACILNSIGDFGLRIFQSSDTKRKNTFSEFLVTRLIVCGTMCLVGLGFAIATGYRAEKLYICMLLIAFRAIENISETYQAEFQLNDRLELGGKTVVYRNIAGLIAFIIVDFITKNVVLSMIGLVIANLLLFILYDLKHIKEFAKTDFKVDKKQVLSIIKACLPLAISTMISMYVINAVKYAIDASEGYTAQTYFNILYMPTFVINMISIFIIKPFLKPLGDYWNDGELKRFVKAVLVIVGVLIGATLCVEIGCYILGIPFLNLLYGIDLGEYKAHLLLLILSGLLYALANVFFNALGIMRKQKLTTVTYVLTAIFALVVPAKLVASKGMTGAVISCIAIMGLLFFFMAVFFAGVLVLKMKGNNKLKEKKIV